MTFFGSLRSPKETISSQALSPHQQRVVSLPVQMVCLEVLVVRASPKN